MRRKSERNKAKSPENKPEKSKRGRPSRKRKKSSSSPERDSASEDAMDNQEDTEVTQVVTSTLETSQLQRPHPEDGSEPVWHVKTAEGSGDTGEIQKLKICLSRPSSTPERPDRSPRGRKKLNRTLMLDSGSEATEDKRKSRHKSRRNSNKDISSVEDASNENDDKDEAVENVSQDIKQEQEPGLKLEADVIDNRKGNEVEEQKTEPMDVDSSKICIKENEDKVKNTESEAKESQSQEEVTNEAANESSQQIVIEECKKIQDVKADMEKCEDQSECNEKGAAENVNEQQGRQQNSEVIAESQTVNESSNSPKHTLEISSTEIIKEQTVEIRTIKNEIKSHESISKEDHSIESSCTRKRRWGSRATKVSKPSTVSISTDSLKSLIPNVEPVSVEDVLLDVKVKEVKDIITPGKRLSVDEQPKPNGKFSAREKVKEKDILGNMTHRKISIVSEELPKEQRPPSPAKHKASPVLYITNLVRPFTTPQLKNLLQRTGKIVDNGFWIDKIKSRCYVQYQSEDEAIETRHALHGVTWPVSNPKTLNVDFGSSSDMQEALAKADDEKPSAGHIDAWHKDSHFRDKIIIKENDGVLEKRQVVREWDVGKGDNREGREERLDRPGLQTSRYPREVLDGDRDRERRKRRSKSPSPARKFKKKEEEAPSKLLDDLFKKTKATPCIYWLPLNPETILIKEEQRRKHMAEHERRMEEMRRATDEQRLPPRHSAHHGSNHRHR